MHILPHALPYFMCHCTEYKVSALQVTVSEEQKLNATTQQFIIAKISGCTWKLGSKTHSSQRSSMIQLQNKASLISCSIQAVQHRKCAAGLAGAHHGLQDLILLNYTRVENAHNLRKKTFHFCYVQNSSKLLVFLFPFWDIIKCMNISVLKTAFLARATVLSLYRSW